ncbi:hypothetical protein [Magnetospira sp. QH-2]|uniref:hypothetical protein n=1 Tax=Magnetospira sp. (strain QH-2) TaxID=1288970 RepID=UPI0003E8133C|nr:hypothetical protein [Magnetospira sp. QH-2]CCQ74947.1 protein of unknown function [Magnetospira sp. QH-2]
MTKVYKTRLEMLSLVEALNEGRVTAWEVDAQIRRLIQRERTRILLSGLKNGLAAFKALIGRKIHAVGHPA